jgi:hypothetical protein
MKCPFCGSEGDPIVYKRISTGGWILFAALLFFCFPLCWLPFIIDGCKEPARKCGSCGTVLV